MYNLVLTVSATCGGLQINAAHSPIEGWAGAYALAWAEISASQALGYTPSSYEEVEEYNQVVVHLLRQYLREHQPTAYNGRGVTLHEHTRAANRRMGVHAAKRRQRCNSQA